MRIDLNADVGESFGAFSIGCDQALMSSITSANIAAGFHGGDPSVLRATIRLAKAHRVTVGAHPGFPDLAGFGRREMRLSAVEIEDLVVYQVAVVRGVASAEGVRLRHVKPHGALYNMAARDPDIAGAIARAVASVDSSLVLIGPPRSCLLDCGVAAGLKVAREGFADRTYEADGSLTPRSRLGAVIHDPAEVIARVIRMLEDRTVVATDGSVLPLEVDTLCIHGDTPGAGALAGRLRAALESSGIAISPIVD